MNPAETSPNKRPALRNLLPLLEQGSAALFTFAINFIASLRMDAVPFVKFTTVWIASLLIVTLSNAVVFQPAMWAIMHQRNHAQHRVLFKASGLLALMLLLATGYYMWVMQHSDPTTSPYNWLTISLIAMISLFEFVRRLLMLSSKWLVSFAINLVMMVTVGLSFIGRPSLNQVWIHLILIYGVAILTALCFAHPMLRPRDEVERKPGLLKDLLSFGTPLLGAGLSFWFITGGYLLLLNHALQPAQSASLRALQNLFSGIMVLLAAFDNWALAQPDRLTLKQARFIEKGLLGVVIAWGLVLSVVAPRLFHKFSVSPFMVLFFTLSYAALSSARLWMSIAKQSGNSMLAMNSQTFACVSFLLLVGVQWYLKLALSATSITILWAIAMMAMWLLVRKKSARHVLEMSA